MRLPGKWINQLTAQILPIFPRFGIILVWAMALSCRLELLFRGLLQQLLLAEVQWGRITASQYPKLALTYPALKLPDLHGEFIRGWDGWRGVDSSRGILSAQTDAIRNITGTFGHLMYETIDAASENAATSSGVFRRLKGTDPVGYTTSNYSNSGAFSSVGNTDNLQDGTMCDASRVVPTANENRPRNIAFNHIVRAA